jgi:hypothetical protein
VENAMTGRRFLTISSAEAGAFSRDGRLLALVAAQADSDGPERLQVWEVAGGKIVSEMPAVDDARILRFTPDGRGIVQSSISEMSFHAVADGRKLAHWKWISRRTSLHITPDGNTLLTGHADGTALAWDLTPYRPKKSPPGDLNRVWEALADGRGEKLVAAVEALSDHPNAAPFLSSKLRPAEPLPASLVQGWCDDLAGPDFRARESAQRLLHEHVDCAVPALEALQKSSPSAEARRRAAVLLNASEVVTSPDLLRDIWAIAALERIGSKDAKALLRDLAAGDPAARLTREARESLERVGK